jgi:hypothetical protein
MVFISKADQSGHQTKDWSKMKFKCVKLVCSQCQKEGIAQLFLNNTGSIRYARVRHFSHNDAVSHKPQFTYCKIDNLDILKDLLKSHNISLDTEKATSGQIGQSQNTKAHDLNKPTNSLNQQNICGCRLVWFRTLAFQANDPGFKSRRPHHFLISIIRF